MLRSWDWFEKVGGFDGSPLDLLDNLFDLFALIFGTEPTKYFGRKFWMTRWIDKLHSYIYMPHKIWKYIITLMKFLINIETLSKMK